MTEYKYNNNSHCKINGTERSILTALSQTLRLVANPVTTGKVPDHLFSACRINKNNLNIIDWIAMMSKLKTIEMMYSIEFKVAIAPVFEMQRLLKFPDLNDKFMHVKPTHPSDSDDVALRCYNFLWVTTKTFEVSIPDGKPFETNTTNITTTNTTTTDDKAPQTPVQTSIRTLQNDVPNNTPVSEDGDSEDILPNKRGILKGNLKDTGKTLGKKQIFSRTNSEN